MDNVFKKRIKSCENPELLMEEARVIIGIMNDADNTEIVELVELTEKLRYIYRRVYLLCEIDDRISRKVDYLELLPGGKKEDD